MKKLNNILRISVLALFVVVMASCKKDDPYAAYTPEREANLIKEWLAAQVTNKSDIDTTSTGIFYIRDKTKVGTGPTVKAGNTVTVKYVGKYLDSGVTFDASAYYSAEGTMTYVHKTDPLITGWEEGIEVLSKGGSASFLIPSAKGYGARGNGDVIPPYTPLIFNIEVVDIQ